MSNVTDLSHEPSAAARALVIAADARTQVARELLSGIVIAAQRIEHSLADQAGRWVALSEVMKAEKDARPRHFEQWAKGLVTDFDASQKATFLRDLGRIKTLHSAAERMLPERVGELHELIFHRPQDFADSGGQIIHDIGEALQKESDANSKHGLFKWASENLKPVPRDRTRKYQQLTEAQQLQKRREAAALNWAACEQQLTGTGSSFVLLEDFAVQAQLGFLQRQITARLRWLKTPRAKRNASAVDTIEAELNPPPAKPAKKH